MNQDIGVVCMLDLSNFINGQHYVTITVKKEYRELQEEFVNRPKLVEVPFWIDRTKALIIQAPEE